MLEIAATLQNFKRHEIYDIAFVRIGDNIVDSRNMPMNQENTHVLVEDSSCGTPEIDNTRKNYIYTTHY